MIEPRMQDIGSGSYELPLSEGDDHEEPESEDSDG